MYISTHFLPSYSVYHSNTPLHTAALHGREVMIRQLVAGGADIEARNKLRSTPLHEAAENGHKVRVEPKRNATSQTRVDRLETNEHSVLGCSGVRFMTQCDSPSVLRRFTGSDARTARCRC